MEEAAIGGQLGNGEGGKKAKKEKKTD